MNTMKEKNKKWTFEETKEEPKLHEGNTNVHKEKSRKK
jgi:hypothetical protein